MKHCHALLVLHPACPPRSGALWRLQEAGTDASPLAALMAHRRVLGVVGLLYCPAAPDVAQAYAAFENQCRQARAWRTPRTRMHSCTPEGPHAIGIGVWMSMPHGGTAFVCRSFPDAVTVRCFAFEPNDAQMQQDTSGMPGLLMFPPGAQRDLNMEVPACSAVDPGAVTFLHSGK
jgi:hypothetical protein